jgi:ABC-type sugar transport system permease subunit
MLNCAELREKRSKPAIIKRVVVDCEMRETISTPHHGLPNDPPRMFLALLAEVWTWTPWYAIFVLAGLQVQPSDPKEAARVDGANAWRVFWHVTLPFLKPVIAVCTLIRTFDAFAHEKM